MVFHWWLSNSKTPRVSRTLLGILADINKAAIWMFSIRPLISNSPDPFSILWGLFRVHYLQLVFPSLSCSMFSFQFPSKVKELIFLFPFFQFYCGLPGRQSQQFGRYSFLFIIIIIIIIIIAHFVNFSHKLKAACLSLESEWQQIYISL